MVVDGRAIARKIIKRLRAQKTPAKTLVALIVDGASSAEKFLVQKEKIAKKLGVNFKICRFSALTATTESILKSLRDYCGSENVGGVIIERPLPVFIDVRMLLKEITPAKNVEAVNELALLVEPATKTFFTILSEIKRDLAGQNIAAIGRSETVALPIGRFLNKERERLKYQSFTIIPARELYKRAWTECLKSADIVVAAARIPNLITEEKIKEGVVVIDFGKNVDFENCKNRASFITPPHGGVGPILVAHVFSNFYALNGSTPFSLIC